MFPVACAATSYEEIIRLGTVLEERLAGSVGSSTWRRGLTALDREHPLADARRVLGFGHGLTQFVTAPLRMDLDAWDAVWTLGAVANLIVTLYDEFVDRGAYASLVLPRSTLEAAAASSWWPSYVSAVMPPKSRLMIRLVILFFGALRRLPHADAHSWISRRIVAAVLRMYEAELATLRPASATEAFLRRKSSLPFVVMGLSGWLAVPTIEEAHYRWHLRWLYRCGDLLGRIDDSIDMIDDARMRRGNRIARARLGSDRSDLQIARDIVRRGKRLMDEWESSAVAGVDGDVQEFFGTCIASWFGRLPTARPMER